MGYTTNIFLFSEMNVTLFSHPKMNATGEFYEKL